MSADLTPEITAQIRLVLERFGIYTRDIDLTDTARVNRILETCGADRYLLCTIGSWKDTISDEEVLEDLKHWLSKGPGSLRPDPSFAKIDPEQKKPGE